MKIEINKYGITINLFDFLFVDWVRRLGRQYKIWKTERVIIGLYANVPVRSIYIQLGRWGGHFGWKSNKNYKKQED